MCSSKVIVVIDIFVRAVVVTYKIIFISAWSLSNAFRQFTVYVRINIISELLRPVEKKQTVSFQIVQQ